MITRRPAPWMLLATGHGSLIVNRNDFRLTGVNILAVHSTDPCLQELRKA